MLVYKGHELRRDDIGGDDYLLAITTAPLAQNIVDHIQVTFQNHALTLDEALKEAKRLNDWFVHAGFKPAVSTDADANEFVAPFKIIDQEAHATSYARHLESYSDVRSAFLDARAQIKSIQPFDLVTKDADVGLSIVNARREREDVGENADESKSASEQEYFLSLTTVARPLNRYLGPASLGLWMARVCKPRTRSEL